MACTWRYKTRPFLPFLQVLNPEELGAALSANNHSNRTCEMDLILAQAVRRRLER